MSTPECWRLCLSFSSVQLSVGSCCPAPATVSPPTLPPEVVLSTSCHITPLFESPSPSLSPQHIRCDFWQEHELLLCPAQATSALPGFCPCFCPGITSRTGQRVFAKLLSPPCWKHWQSCLVLLVPLAWGQREGGGCVKSSLVPWGTCSVLCRNPGVWLSEAIPTLSRDFPPQTAVASAVLPAHLFLFLWRSWAGGQCCAETSCCLILV